MMTVISVCVILHLKRHAFVIIFVQYNFLYSLRPKKNDVLGFKICPKKNDVLLNLASLHVHVVMQQSIST
jgi:hypothetical protein